MRKYTQIAGIYLKSQLIWRADVIFNMIFTVSKIIFAYILWGIIFEGKDVIAGFTFHSMLSYYIISAFLSQIDMSDRISSEITTGIRNGTFSKYLVIPVHPEKYFLAMGAGMVTFYILFDLLVAVLCIFIFEIKLVITQNPMIIAISIAMILLGLLFMAQLNYFMGLLTFKYQEIKTFLMIKDNFGALITGAIIPLVLLPDLVVNLMKLFPFYYVTYLPSMLLTERCREEAAVGLAVLAFWCILMSIVNKRTYETYRLKYDGVGI